MGIWEAVAVLVSVYQDQRWIVHALAIVLVVLVLDRLRSSEYFDKIPVLDVHVDPGGITMHAPFALTVLASIHV